MNIFLTTSLLLNVTQKEMKSSMGGMSDHNKFLGKFYKSVL